jgi:hypothetical protein
MKTKIKLVIPTLVVMFFTSCSVKTSFYQVYKTMSSEKLIENNNSLVYEDLNCKVFYNLWGEGGNIGFKFYNKTESDIFLDLEKCFFILNGVSYDYYRNRTYTKSTSKGGTSISSSSSSSLVTGTYYSNLIQTNKLQTTNNMGVINSVASSISFNEKKIVCIPSKTSKDINEYNIYESIYRDCNLLRYPISSKNNSITFTKNNSPIVFSNRISYSIGDSKDFVQFENEFYVSQISNYTESQMFKYKFEEYCDQQSVTMNKYFNYVSPYVFYNAYTKTNDFWKH